MTTSIKFKPISSTRFLAAAIFLAASFSAFAQATTSDAIAEVNGHAISTSEYYHRMEFLGDMGTLVGKQYVEVSPGLMTLDRLITEQLVLQLAEKYKVSPTAAQVDQLERDALSANPLLEKNWTESGRPLSELRLKYKLEAARFNILTRGIIVTDQEVKDQYNTHLDQYTLPKRVHLRVIILSSSEEEAKVDSALQAGTPFDKVAQEYSDDITKERGGDFGFIPESNLPSYFKTALEGVKIGETTGWGVGSSQSGRTFYFKLLFVNAAPQKVLPLDSALTDSIRRALMVDRGTKLHDIAKELNDLRGQSKIVINNPTFAEQYAQVSKSLKSSGK